MIRSGLLLNLVLLIGGANAQCVISQDPQGRVITTCQIYQDMAASQKVHQGAVTHTQARYLGSEYFTFPIWQDARVSLAGREIPCKLAYNLRTQEVEYQLDQAATAERVQPDAFTVDGYRFIRKTMLGSAKYGFYLMVVHDGSTRLLKLLQSQLKPGIQGNGYTKADELQGYFEQKETYYIQKENDIPQPISLTSKALLDVLKEQASVLAARIPTGKLTLEETIATLKTFDQLTADALRANARKAGPALNYDPAFTHTLQTKIKFPPQALNERVYSRVYAGFEIDANGHLQNLVMLSPDNVGYAFDYQVKQALKKLPVLRPEYAGQYVLPVAFTYIHAGSKLATLVPINTLPVERMGNRIVLNELTVPIVDSASGSPGQESREVWGYYR